MNIRAFNQIIQDFATKDVPALVVAVQRRIVLDALPRLVDRTPVDTGNARGNWQVAIGERPTGTIHPPLIPSLGYPRYPRPSLSLIGQQTVDEGSRFIRDNLVTFCVCHLTNNVHYILELEDGKSRQTQPHQILALTFDEIVAAYA